MWLDLAAPGRACRVGKPLVGRSPAIRDVEAAHDARLVWVRAVRARGGLVLRLDRDVDDLFLLSAEQREDAMRWRLREILGKIEIVGELGTGFLLVFAHLGGEPPG